MSEPIQNQDFIVSELLSELKASNERKDERLREKDRLLWRVIVTAAALIAAIVAGFLVYLNQYDFSSCVTTTTNADGVYAVVDSEGNVITSDLSPDELQKILEGTDGTSVEDSYGSSQED